jgi:hyperosmotically inducible periplasmic protein
VRCEMKPLVCASLLGLAAALGAAGCAGPGESRTERSAGEFTDDAAITAKVKSAIATQVGARTAAVVNVDTYRGTVQLTGFVDDKKTAEQAEAAAKKVSGVRAVKNSIRLKSSS